MRICQYMGCYDRRTKSRKSCNKIAYYEWRFKDNTDFMCKEHGESLAGNFTHELRAIFKRGHEPQQ